MLNAPIQNRLSGPHDYIVAPSSVPTPRPSPPPVSGRSVDPSMESSRAGLPPPSSLGLPPPDVAFATMNAMNQSLPPPPPPPPPQRHGSDPSYYSWLESKTEEDRRRQEEEKTRQESLRLEQRKIEQSMLRDSLQAGVPPHLIPLIFAGISQGGVPQCVLDLTQQYMPQPSAGPRGPSTPLLNAAHPPPRRVPHVRQDSRSLPPNPYAAAPPPQPVPGPGVLLSQPLHPPGASPTTHSLSRPPVPSNSADPRPPGAARVPSGDAQAPPPSINLSNVQYAPGSSVPSAQHSSNRHDVPSRQSPPSLYFHHWIPPNQSHHPSAKSQQDPSATQPPRRSEYQSPPGPGRKRKSAGSHPPPPLPSSRPPETLSSSQSSRPESPHRQYSDMTTSSETGGPGPLDPDPTRPYPRDMPPTEDSRANRRRADTSTSESNPPLPRPSLHTRYDASMEPGPRDSDLDSSPGPSPTTRTHSTQSGRDAPASTGPRARHR